MLYPRLCVVIASCAFLITGVVNAAESPVAVIPSQSGMVIRFRNPTATIAKVADIAERLLPQHSSAFVAQEKPSAAIAELDDSERGLVNAKEYFGWGETVRGSIVPLFEQIGSSADAERDWWLFSLNPDDDDAAYVWIIPAKDAEVLRAELDESRASNKNSTQAPEAVDAKLFVFESWVIYGSAEGIEAAKRCLDGQENSIGSRWNDDARTVFYQGDVGVIIDVNRLAKSEIAPDLQEFVSEMLFEPLNMLPFDVNFMSLAKLTVEAASKVPNPLPSLFSQGISDTEYLAISLVIEPDEIRLENYQCVKADSPTSILMRTNPGSEMEVLSRLPASSVIVLGLQGNWKAMTAWLAQVLKTNNDEKNSRYTPAHAEVLKGYEQLNYGSCAVAFPMRPLEQGLLRALTITEVAEPASARELGLKWSALPDCTVDHVEENFVRSASTEKYGEFSADVVLSPPIVDFGDGFLGNLLHGPDGNMTRTVCMKDQIVRGFGGSKARMAAALRRISEVSRGESDRDPRFEQLREKLGKKVNAIVIVDAAGLVVVSMQLWNRCIEVMEASIDEQAIEVTGFNPPQNQSELDEGLPPGESSNGEQPDDSEEEDVPDMNANVAQMGAMEIEVDDDLAQAKFQKEEIDSMNPAPSLIGVSLAFEPQASRIRVVIPFAALQQITKAGEVFVRRIAPEMFDVPAAAVDEIEIEAPPEIEEQR